MQKAEELIQKLEPLVEKGLDFDNKSQWLDTVKKEIAEFKKIHQPEFLDLSKLHNAG